MKSQTRKNWAAKWPNVEVSSFHIENVINHVIEVGSFEPPFSCAECPVRVNTGLSAFRIFWSDVEGKPDVTGPKADSAARMSVSRVENTFRQ